MLPSTLLNHFLDAYMDTMASNHSTWLSGVNVLTFPDGLCASALKTSLCECTPPRDLYWCHTQSILQCHLPGPTMFLQDLDLGLAFIH